MRLARVRLVLALALPGGCALIDQTTFNPDAGKPPLVATRPPPAPVLPASSGPPALLTVRFADSAPFADELRDAVAAARARKRDVAFDVVAVTPVGGSPADQAARAEAGGEDAARVAEVIVAEGVPPGRVRLGSRTEPSVLAREVRVYVR